MEAKRLGAMGHSTVRYLVVLVLHFMVAAPGFGQEATVPQERDPLPDRVVLDEATEKRFSALGLEDPEIIRRTRLLLLPNRQLAAEDTANMVRLLMEDDRPEARRAAVCLLGGPNRYGVLCVIRKLWWVRDDIGPFLAELDKQWNTLWEKDLVALATQLHRMDAEYEEDAAINETIAELVSRLIWHRSRMVPPHGIALACKGGLLEDARIHAALVAQTTNTVYNYFDNVHPIRKAALEALGREYTPPEREAVDHAQIGVAEDSGLAKRDTFTVGVVGSLYTAKGPCIGGGDEYGWGGPHDSLRILAKHGMTPLLYLHPISQLAETPLPRMREQYAIEEPVLNAACAADLAMADVLLLNGLHNMRAETVDALEEYVWRGGGIVSICGPGMVTCLDPQQLAVLQDMQNLEWGWSSVPDETFEVCITNALTAGLDWSLPIVSPGHAFNTGSYMLRSSKYASQILLRHHQIRSPALRISSYGDGLIAHFGCGMSFNDDELSKRNWELFSRVLRWAGKQAFMDLRPEPAFSKQRYNKKRIKADITDGSVAQRFEQAYFLENGKGALTNACAIYEGITVDAAASKVQVKQSLIRLVALLETLGRREEAIEHYRRLMAHSDHYREPDAEVDVYYAGLDPETRVFIQWSNRAFFRRNLYVSPLAVADMDMAQRREALQTYRQQLEHPARDTRNLAIEWLGALRDKESVKPLLAIATEPRVVDNRARWLAVRALGRIGDRHVVPELIHLLDHYNKNTRLWAKASLWRLAGQHFGDDKDAWGGWWNESGGKPRFEPGKVYPKPDDDGQASNHASAAPVVVRTLPEAGDIAVDPALTEIRVTFSREMSSGSWSCVGGGVSFPGSENGIVHFTNGNHTFVIPVDLKPDHFYRMWLNSVRHTGFKDAGGTPAEPYLLTFKTLAADGRANPIQYPGIVSVFPSDGDTAIDPGTREFVVTFDEAMDGGMSWVGQIPTTGPGRWDTDMKTCRLPVSLEADTGYTFWLNNGVYQNFSNTRGVPAVSTRINFRTMTPELLGDGQSVDGRPRMISIREK